MRKADEYCCDWRIKGLCNAQFLKKRKEKKCPQTLICRYIIKDIIPLCSVTSRHILLLVMPESFQDYSRILELEADIESRPQSTE